MVPKLTIIIVLSLSPYIFADDCETCERSECPHVEFCPFGVTQDACACCDICAQRLGEKCDPEPDEGSEKPKRVHGLCGEFLTCSEKGLCECEDKEPVCGSDGVTYSSVCGLLEETVNNRELTLIERQPCRTGPKIKTAPKDSERPIGSILVLDCEATGYPVPKITWELYRPDGSTIQLPSDDPLLAVQVRGGPEKHMVTGWVQIMKIVPENSGIYSCIATNEKGTAKGSAKVSYKEAHSTENEI